MNWCYDLVRDRMLCEQLSKVTVFRANRVRKTAQRTSRIVQSKQACAISNDVDLHTCVALTV